MAWALPGISASAGSKCLIFISFGSPIVLSECMSIAVYHELSTPFFCAILLSKMDKLLILFIAALASFLLAAYGWAKETLQSENLVCLLIIMLVMYYFWVVS